jgi:hypothetical protein
MGVYRVPNTHAGNKGCESRSSTGVPVLRDQAQSARLVPARQGRTAPRGTVRRLLAVRRPQAEPLVLDLIEMDDRIVGLHLEREQSCG